MSRAKDIASLASVINTSSFAATNATAYTNVSLATISSTNATVNLGNTTANLVISQTSAYYSVNSTANSLANSTAYSVANSTAYTNVGLASIQTTAGVLRIGNTTANSIVNTTVHSVTNATAYSNIDLNSIQTTAGVLRIGNTTANVVANTTSIIVQASTSQNAVINSTGFYVNGVSVAGASFSNGTAYTWSANQTFNNYIISDQGINFGQGGFTAAEGISITNNGIYLTDGTNSPIINAVSINIANSIPTYLNVANGKFIAQSGNVAIAVPLNANGSTGSAGQVLTSNGSFGSPYWATASGGGSGMVLISNGNVSSLSGYPPYLTFGATLYAKYILFLEGVSTLGGTTVYLQPNTSMGTSYTNWRGTGTTTIAQDNSNTATVYATSINYTVPGPPTISLPQGAPIFSLSWNQNITQSMAGFNNGYGYIIFEGMNSSTSPFSMYPTAVGEFTYYTSFSTPFSGSGMVHDRISVQANSSFTSNVSGLFFNGISSGYYTLYGVPQ